MNKIFKILLSIFSICLFATTVLAGSYKLQYKMVPGQTWLATISTEKKLVSVEDKDVSTEKKPVSAGDKDVFTEKKPISAEDKDVSTENKDVSQFNTTIEYKISNGPEKDWISLTARIKSQDHPSGNKNAMQINLSKIEYIADMNRSGKINNAKHSGNVFPPLDDKIKEHAPKRAAMYEKSSQMIAETWKNIVFWFPELPEDAMKPGDKFEVTKEMDMGNEASGMNMQGVSKQVFTLKEVRDGLAFFMVKGHATSESSKSEIGKSDATTEEDGEAVFSLQEGMFTDFTIKSQGRMHFSNIRSKSEKFQDLYHTSKIHMEKQ